MLPYTQWPGGSVRRQRLGPALTQTHTQTKEV